MIQISREVYLVLIFGIFSVFATLFLAGLVIHNRLDSGRPMSHFAVFGGTKEFLLTPENNFLNILVLIFRNSDLSNNDNLVFTLLSANDKKLRTIDFSGRNIGYYQEVRFQFDPIPNSKGEKLKVRLESLESDPRSTPIKIGLSNDEELAFTSYYRPENRTGIFTNILTNFVKKVFEDVGFFVSWILFIITVLVVGRARKQI